MERIKLFLYIYLVYTNRMFINKVIQALESNRVNYVVVGGYAVALHGAVRGTVDIDLAITLSMQSFENTEKAMINIGLQALLPVNATDVFNYREEYIRNRNLISWSFSNPDNPLENVTSKQAKEIFEGQVSNWAEISPGNSQLIKPVGRLHCKTRTGHWRALLKSEDDFSPRLFEVGVIPDMISQVSRSASSIGWETPLMVDAHRNKGDVKVLNIDGHSPSDIEYVLTGKYPLYRSYSLTAWTEKSKTNDEAIKLIKFLRQHIEKVHQDISFIPVSKLKEAGWKFMGDELVGEPGMDASAKNMSHHEH